MANTAIDIQKLYIAYFNRPADKLGLAYWMDSSMSVAQIAESFSQQKEYADLYAGKDLSVVVNSIYKNLFGRDADVDGLVYWVNQINSKKVTLGAAAISILNGAKDADKVAVDSKVTASEAFTKAIDTTQEINAYSATVNYSTVGTVKSWLAGVKDATTLAAATAAVNTTLADVVAGGDEGGKLTSGTDKLSGTKFTADQVYTPGGDNRINSLQDEDELTGTGERNVLNATLGNANDNGGTTITPKLVNMDVVNVMFTGSNSSGGNGAVDSLDVQDATRMDEVNINRITSPSNLAKIENIQSVLSKMQVKDTNANQSGTVEFSFGADVLKGANKGSVNLANVQLGTLNIGQNLGSGSGVSTQSYEDLTINSTKAANNVGEINLPMDTGTDGKITITGDKALNLTKTTNVTSSAIGANNIEAVQYSGGFQGVNGRLATIDASALAGNLTLNIASGTFTTGKADTSGVLQNVSIIGGKGNDTFVLNDSIQSGDSLTGGDGTDTLIVNGGSITSTSGSATKIENVQLLGNNQNPSVDFSKVPDAVSISVRNIGNSGGATPVGQLNGTVTATLNKLNATQAANIDLFHSTTGNGDATVTKVVANLADSSGSSDTVGVNIKDAVNTSPEFNFTLTAAGAENITINDLDTESNNVILTSHADHKGTLKITGGAVGTDLNFDLDTAAVAGGTYGLNRVNINDLTSGNGTGNVDVSTVSTVTKFKGTTVDATGAKSNITVRLDNNAASTVGAQKVTMGDGNDTVIFDKINDTRAGLTISDTVDGGAGNDTLALDGNLSAASQSIVLGASEWTNVSNFETIKLVGGGSAAAYQLTLTDTLISKNNKDGALSIVNDNDPANNFDNVTTAGAQRPTAAVIDARALNNTSKFNYNGEEGNVAGNVRYTKDRLIFSDVNLNGSHNIDGGAWDSLGTTYAANDDVLEIRNTTVASAGDLANISNVGQISFTNDQAVAQVLTLELNDTIVDAMVNSNHNASATEVETLKVVINESALTSGITAVAGLGLKLDVTGMTNKTSVEVTLAASGSGAVGSANDTISLSTSSAITVANFVAGGSGDDQIQLSKSLFTQLVSTAGNGFSTTADLNLGVAAVSNTSAGYIKVDTSGGSSKVYFDADGTGAGVAILIGTFNGAVLTAADFDIVS